MLDDLADSLEAAVNMDPVRLATTGFTLHKETEQTMEPPSVPRNPRFKRTGKAGEAQLLFSPPARAKSFMVQAATSAAGPFVDYKTFSSSRGVLLQGFSRAQDLWARVAANRPNNTVSGWSAPVSILIN